MKEIKFGKLDEKTRWIEIIQFAKGWYNDYFPKNQFDGEYSRNERLKVVQGILCGMRPEDITMENMLHVVSGIFFTNILLGDSYRASNIFTDLVSLDRFYPVDIKSKKDAQNILLDKMLSEIGMIQVKEQDENGKYIQIFPIGEKNQELIEKIKEYFKNKEN